jgi:putative Ca2+/H+ antiporter (TMEM165/GDT1 family)
MEYVKIAAAASFIIFGLWTIRGDKLQDEDKKYKFSPFWTVTIAFFIAEMGDKTQLATIALAVEYNIIIPVWIGTTLGMLISNAIGIIFGNVMGKRIPENAIKWAAALIFIGFGIWGLYDALPKYIWSPVVVTACAILLGLSIYVMYRIRGKEPQLANVCKTSASSCRKP